VSRYWDRVNRCDQLPFSLFEAMRVLTSPAQTGAVTVALPQDVQAEAWEFPASMFEKHVWHIPRQPADRVSLSRAIEWIRSSRLPLIVAGGGVHYSEAERSLAKFVEQTGIPVCETQAGKGSLPYNHPQQLGAVGVTGTIGANIIAREADLVIGIGTRYSDFTTASKTAFQNPQVRFININVAEIDAHKHKALPLITDARITLDELSAAVAAYRIPAELANRVDRFRSEWETEVDRIYNLSSEAKLNQGNIIGLVNELSEPRDVLVCAAGSLPGDLHKLWRTRDCKGYHMEYGYSCMGYEIAGGLGVKMADPSREVYVMVGDGSYQMMSSEIVTSLQEGYKLNIVLINNHGFGSIGGLSKAVGAQGYGTEYRYREPGSRLLEGDFIPVDFAANAASFGAHVIEAETRAEFEEAMSESRKQDRTTVIVVNIDKESRVPGYESWWDVPVAEVSEVETAIAARKDYEKDVKRERYFL
jgi:3D-(3,5/4)-trihydroxycyclohexane-1,2-dione acylhydrolase (decyclizing)